MDSCYYNRNSFFYYLDENKFISFITSFTFAVIFIFIYILKTYTFFEKRRIPRTGHPTAPFGNIKDVLFQKTTLYVFLWKYYKKIKKKGYKYGGLYLFFKPGLLVVDPIIIQNISTQQRSIRDGCRKDFSRSGNVLDLFTEVNLENFLIRYNGIKDTLLINVNEKCISSALHNFFMETTALAFGFKINSEVLSVVNALLVKKTNSSFRHYFELVYPFFDRNVTPDLEMQNIIKGIVENRKKNDLRETDLLQSFIDLYNKDDYNSNEIILDIFDVFVDNVTYANSSLLFCLFELASNTDIQQNLIQEIRRFNEQNKSIHLKGLQQLYYLDAVVKETLRKYPPVPVIIKKCQQHHKIDNIDLELPNDIFILYSIMGAHYDPFNYLEPGKFNPARFLDEFNEVSTSNAYIPFGLDMWKEIGFRFTALHIKLGLISILSSYSVNKNNKYCMEFNNKKLPIYPKEPIPIIFKRIE